MPSRPPGLHRSGLSPLFVFILLATTLLARCACRDSVPAVYSPGCGESCAQGETCVRGQCVPETCAGSVCNTNEACANGHCVDRSCVGVECPGTQVCVKGQCLPHACGDTSCGLNEACIDGTCQDVRCASHDCPDGKVCANGACYAESCGGTACRPGLEVCVDGTCTDRRCVGVVCPEGLYCVEGSCGKCPAGTFEQDGRCVPKQDTSAACTDNRQCTSGQCVDGVCCATACNGPCEACGSDGLCAPLPAGGEDPMCGTYVCNAAGACETKCTTHTQCQADARCIDGTCQARRPQGTACVTDVECKSGHCVDGVCCDTACEGACDSCAQEGHVGECSPLPANTVGTPTCAPYLCDGTGSACPEHCEASTSCDVSSFCESNKCVPKRTNGQTCTQAYECASSHCVDGVCCDMACDGACDACNLPGKEGLCTPVAAGTSGNPSCAPYVCDGTSASCPGGCTEDTQCAEGNFCNGAGKCEVKKGSGDSCGANNQCTSGNCVDGVCCNTACGGSCDACNVAGSVGTCIPVASGSSGNPACAPYVCTGSSSSCPLSCTSDAQCDGNSFCSGGACVPKQGGGQTCSAAGQCASGNCVDGVCCNTACGGSCDACNVAGSVGTCTPVASRSVGNPACAPYVCTGSSSSCPTACTTDAQCDGNNFCSGGACVPKMTNGASCSAAGQCISGSCVDGVCCNTACGGSCDACNVAGSVGTCTPVASGSSGNPACAPYVCTGSSSSCPSSCTTDAQCDGNNFCSGGACVPKMTNGASCSAAGQCISGSCVDGVCCNTACGGSCDACNVAGSVGTCTPVASGSSGNPACAPYVCTGSSSSCPSSCTTDAQCDGNNFCSGGACVPKMTNGASCSAADQCISGSCVDGVCCNTACGGSCDACNVAGSVGTCTPVASRSVGNPACAPYVCTGSSSSCPSSCTSDTQCDNNSFCNGGACVPKQDNGQTCSAANQCGSGNCVDGVCCNSACAGACDSCNLPGSMGTCSLTPPTKVCRDSTGICDVAEYCTGTSNSCPVDGFQSSGTTCTSDNNACTQDVCNGSGTCSHPLVATGTSCGSGLVCDSTGQCLSGCWIAGAYYAAGATNPSGDCQVCNPSASTTSWSFKPSTTQCRASAGTCDVAEYCTGTTATCPADAKQPSSTMCRNSAGICDVAEYCTGTSNTCPADGFAANSTVCRNATGECDVAEYCTGSGASCPTDGFKSSGTTCTADTNACTQDVCNGSGTCSHPLVTAGSSCGSGLVCDSTGQCLNGCWIAGAYYAAGTTNPSGDCQVCNPSASTTSWSFKPSTTQCRASAGACDVAEFCTGTTATCPTDAKQPSSTVCRNATGECDVTEFCTGTSNTCPTDGFKSSGTTCTADTNACTQDVCNGSGTCGHPLATAGSSCGAGLVCDSTGQCLNGCWIAGAYYAAGATNPSGDCQVCNPSASTTSWSFKPSTTQCRASAGACDVAEFCTGTTATCPADAKQPSSTVCRNSAGICDVAEFCTGTSNTCPADGFASSSTTCRNATGECDVAEYCTGSGASCPTDGFKSSGTSCTADTNACTQDVCNGSGTCGHPLVTAGSSCGSGLVCDSTGQCLSGCWIAGAYYAAGATNPSGDCQVCNPSASTTSWSFKPSTTQCRASAGACDVAEFCTGTTATCPADAKQPSSTMCRNSAGICDVAEYCTGTSNTCPADGFASSGKQCRGSSGVCDVAEYCTGASASCPGDGYAANGTGCGTSYGSWGSCGGYSDYCDSTGTQSRSVTNYTCSSGTCTATSTGSDSQSCSRVAPGPTTCSPTYGSWSACGGFSDYCASTGTQTRQVTNYTYNCSTGTCSATSTSSESQSCTRVAPGPTSCPAPTYGAWSACTGGSCARQGTQTRSVTNYSYSCASGSCVGTSGSVSQSCTLSPSDGCSCAPGYSSTYWNGPCTGVGLQCGGAEGNYVYVTCSNGSDSYTLWTGYFDCTC